MYAESLFDLKNEDGPDVQISHKRGSKYWIKTPRGEEEFCTQKIIILQQMQSNQLYFIFTENCWSFKSIPFWLQPGSEYRCMVYYSSISGTTYFVEIGAISATNSHGQRMPTELRQHHLVQTTKQKITSIYFTKEELNKIKIKAVDFVHRIKQRVSTIPYFYRNKSVDYFDDIMHVNDGVMYPAMKDNNGDRYSIINSNMAGIFFSGLLLPSTLQPPKTSIFGTRRLYVKSTMLFNHNTKMYFADFYCYNKIVHYLTIVLTKPGSLSDQFCEQNLVELDIYSNPFLQLSVIDGVQRVLVTLNVIIEIFYTEPVDLFAMSMTPGVSMYEDVPLTGRGSSVEGGIPKKEDCQICNLRVSKP